MGIHSIPLFPDRANEGEGARDTGRKEQRSIVEHESTARWSNSMQNLGRCIKGHSAAFRDAGDVLGQT